MIVTVLGSAAAGGNPGSGCSGYLVRTGHTAVLIDCGPGTVGEVERWIDPVDLDGIVISHMHLDHWLDLVTLRASLRYRPEPSDRRVPLWLPPDGERILDGLAAPLDLDHQSPLFFDRTFVTREYNPLDTLIIGDVSIDFAPGHHAMPSWAMRISRVGTERALGYTADTGPVTNLATFLRGVDVLLAEATLLESDESPIGRGHLTAAEAGRLAQTCQASRLVLTHFWSQVGTSRLIESAAERFDGPIEIAWPGAEYEL